MSISFENVSRLLKISTSLENPPVYSINKNYPVQNDQLLEKLKYQHEKWLSQLKKVSPNQYPLSFVGCCEIGKFTGVEIQRILYDIFQNKEFFSPGNWLLFTIKGDQCAAVLCVTYKTINITKPPEERFQKRLFKKLFDDKSIQKKREKYPHYYNEDDINNLREQAKQQYPNFLREKLVEFQSVPYRLAFFGVSADIAFQHSCKNLIKNISIDEDHDIPYAACVKLAIDDNISGIVTDLFGELGPDQENTPNIKNRKAKLSSSTSKNIIRSTLSSNDMLDENIVNEKVREILQIYHQ